MGLEAMKLGQLYVVQYDLLKALTATTPRSSP